MKKVVVAVLLAAAGTVFAQTEDDLLRWVAENRPKAESGQMSQLQFHREMHRRLSEIPASTYPFKAFNMRWVGDKIDILEAQEAGKITKEQAQRRLAQVDAEVETADAARLKANQDQAAAADQERERQIRERSERLQAETRAQVAADEQQRRALLLQMIQNNQARQPQPYQLQPYVLPTPMQSTCSSMWNGVAVQTVCR
jgi:hypothetical protein